MKRWVKFIAVGLVIAIGIALVLHFKKSPERNALLTRELATFGLGEYLAGKYPGQIAVIVSNPFTQRPGMRKEIYENEAAGIRGITRAFDKKITLKPVAFPGLKPEAVRDPYSVVVDPGTSTPLSFMVADDAFDKLAQQSPSDLIVSLVGLPVAVDRLEVWNAPGGPKFALLLPDLRVIGDAAAVGQALQRGKLAAFVLSKPKAPSEQVPLGKDQRAEFEKRFLLVTPENWDQVVQTYPQLFQFKALPKG